MSGSGAARGGDGRESGHVGYWQDRESSSGQADLFRIVCSCGWQSRWIWSRYEEQEIGEAFNAHQDRAGEQTP